MKNLLSEQPSLYLKQHSQQPVNWFPWGDEAFEIARKLNKPIILSIGYSACHWCHVMSKESFEDSYIASIMNRHFICIKVDREERPDIDQTYLEAVRMFNQSAGWPLNVFCLPNGRPFWGGTYFPDKDKGQNIVPWPQVLMRIADHYKREYEELEENANNVVSNLLHTNNAILSNGGEWKDNLLLIAANSICESHDEKDGGFTPAPKFPSPMKLDFLMSIKESQSVRTNKQLALKIDFCITNTLNNMASKGLFDHVSGGFFRYSVDKEWKIPHFEKMLYDNALMITSYSRAFQSFQNSNYKEVVFQTVKWLKKEMLDSKGGFISSISADSEGKEGEYYLHDIDEIKDSVSKESYKVLTDAFCTSKENGFGKGKFLPYPNKNISHESKLYKAGKKILLTQRKKKHRPECDRKKILSWNALLLGALTDAARSFKKKEWLGIAIELNEWMIQNFIDAEFEISSIVFESGIKSNHNFIEDYAIWAESLLNLSSISEWAVKDSAVSYINLAKQLALFSIKNFKDEKISGYFCSRDGINQPAQVRKKFWYDNATPSGNSSLLNVFAKLYHITGEEIWLQEFQEAKSAYPRICTSAPQGIGHALNAITEKAVGISSIECKFSDVAKVISALSRKPYRPVFIKPFKNENVDSAKLTIENNLISESSNPLELIDKLFS